MLDQYISVPRDINKNLHFTSENCTRTLTLNMPEKTQFKGLVASMIAGSMSSDGVIRTMAPLLRMKAEFPHAELTVAHRDSRLMFYYVYHCNGKK